MISGRGNDARAEASAQVPLISVPRRGGFQCEDALLGEVHDNGGQHALRLAALKRYIAAGARPAIAFEQFDRERQPDIDRLRIEQPGNAAAIVALGAPGWNWKQYLPFVQLALDYNVPIIATNLSRNDAMRIGTEGWNAVFEPSDRVALGLDSLPAELITGHERAIARGHCDLLPQGAVAALAQAQISRDIVMARAIAPYIENGVVLLAGNGHVRKDIGVRIWLTPGQRATTTSIGLVERDGAPAIEMLEEQFDAVVLTNTVERPDPCAPLRQRLSPAGP
jgi:uncharacterized iron-regulated protein